jgi:hypothetical protein
LASFGPVRKYLMNDQAADPARVPVAPQTADDLGPATTNTIYPVARKPFDPTKSREVTRGRLAAFSFALFAVITLLLVLAVICGWRTWDELEGLATSVVPVVVSVVGATTGFYFGVKEGRDS